MLDRRSLASPKQSLFSGARESEKQLQQSLPTKLLQQALPRVQRHPTGVFHLLTGLAVMRRTSLLIGICIITISTSTTRSVIIDLLQREASSLHR